MITFVSLFGLDFGVLVGGGALLTEVVFGLPGVGLLTYRSLQYLDLPVIMATVIYGAFFIVIANAVVDILYARLDPRIREPVTAWLRAAARGPRPPGVVQHRGRRRARRRRRLVHARRGRGARHRRRVRLGQERDDDVASCGSIRDPNASFEGEVLYDGPRPDAAARGRDARGPRRARSR